MQEFARKKNWDQKCLGLKFENIIAIFEISSLEFAKILKYVQNKITSNLGSRMSHLRFFGLKAEKTIVIFEISTLKFVKMQKLI